VPVVGNAIALDGQNVGGDEIDGLTDAFCVLELPGEVT